MRAFKRAYMGVCAGMANGPLLIVSGSEPQFALVHKKVLSSGIKLPQIGTPRDRLSKKCCLSPAISSMNEAKPCPTRQWGRLCASFDIPVWGVAIYRSFGPILFCHSEKVNWQMALLDIGLPLVAQNVGRRMSDAPGFDLLFCFVLFIYLF